MAYIGLAKPIVAKLASQSTSTGVTTPTYSDGFVCGKAISLNVTPNYNEVKLFADNILDEYVKEFKDGTISLGTDRLPIDAQTVMFGHTVTGSTSTEEVTYKTGDSANYVGVGFYIDEMLDGAKSYTGTVIYRCKFTEAADDFTTKGDSIEFKTPTLEGAISALDDGKWKITKKFATEAAAEAWIKSTLGLTS